MNNFSEKGKILADHKTPELPNAKCKDSTCQIDERDVSMATPPRDSFAVCTVCQTALRFINSCSP